ncbi:MAG: LemA family protein [Cytophagaceae bacterium]|nr:LemA family protein [Cytophagaceae bacterium]MDW8455148.1 LemA family protein [Cytophagaceae bacterium]
MKKIYRHFLFLFLISSLLSSCGYNTMIEKEEKVNAALAEVKNQFKRRSDLIPQLVEVVKGVSNFEKSTLEAVIEARSKATSVNLDASDLSPEKIAQFQKAQENFSGALSRLMVVVEKYPELKATQNFSDLQVQLEGTANRITVAIRNFNQAVQDYNTYIKKFPNNMVAGLFGFKQKGYFEVSESEQKNPEIKF